MVSPFDNVRLVGSGHSAGEAQRSDRVAQQPVHRGGGSALVLVLVLVLWEVPCIRRRGAGAKSGAGV